MSAAALEAPKEEEEPPAAAAPEMDPTPAEALGKKEAVPTTTTQEPTTQQVHNAWNTPGAAAQKLSDLDASLKVAKVHPIVVFSILDHFTRRQEGQERVIGTLLGVKSAGGVEITNCFAVPHTEKEGEVAVGQATNKSMFALLSRINDREKIVGWYATTSGANKLDESSSLIHDFYVQECENPVHLVVDTCLDPARGVQLDAYCASGLGSGGLLEDYVRPLSVELCFTDPELLCVDKMIKNQPFTSPETITRLGQDDAEPLRASLENISSLVDTCLDYCYDVQQDASKHNPDTTRHILNALDALPHLDPKDLDRAFNAHTQDITMVNYLANVTKTQLSIASKIHSTF
mmetsp:Transcript_22380/g.68922  ORF Transcript_22380/g.68922 Transcript_22380/m.68922 type:complete len:347 (+) Transcript_22380:17-1057(+)